jgi:RimJ/RimL family protein N-acetyltransferase
MITGKSNRNALLNQRPPGTRELYKTRGLYKRCIMRRVIQYTPVMRPSLESLSKEDSPVDKMRFDGLTSDRLILRRFSGSDLVPFMAYRNDPAIARYQSWDACSEQEALELIEEQKSMERMLPGRWLQIAIELKESGCLVGDCALKIDSQDERQAEIGFTISREHQGKGYGSEAVARLLDHLFADVGLHRVIAITDCENQASVALMQRIGMRREGHFIQNIWFKGKWSDEFLYAVLGAEWLRKNQRRGFVKIRGA